MPQGMRTPTGTAATRSESPLLGDWVRVPAGTYRLGEGDRVRRVLLPAFRIGRYPVTNTHLAMFLRFAGRAAPHDMSARLATPALGDHPAVGLDFDDATALCAWASALLGEAVRLPTGDEWEAAARGGDGRHYPWGTAFDDARCACAERGRGTTEAVTAHPAGASPFGAEQMSGNVWEWTTDTAEDGAWRTVRGGSYLDTAWGLRVARVLSADPARATTTTGLRLVADGP